MSQPSPRATPARRPVLLLLLALVPLLLPACGSEPSLEAIEAPRDERLELQVAGRSVRVELALDNPTRNRGLMHRTSLAEDVGMLFVFPDSAPRTFWMRNTLVPLDIIFLDDAGRVINVEEAPPMVERPGFHSARAARFVLELRRGWCAEHGLQAGDRIEIPAEVAARGI